MRAISDEATREVAGIVGAILFGGASVIELVRVAIEKVPWPGFNVALDWAITLIAIAIWLPSAVVLATRSRQHRVLAIVGAFTLFCYGLLGTMGRSIFGVVYIAFGAVMPIVERLAFGGKVSLGAGTETPPRPSSGPREIL